MNIDIHWVLIDNSFFIFAPRRELPLLKFELAVHFACVLVSFFIFCNYDIPFFFYLFNGAWLHSILITLLRNIYRGNRSFIMIFFFRDHCYYCQSTAWFFITKLQY